MDPVLDRIYFLNCGKTCYFYNLFEEKVTTWGKKIDNKKRDYQNSTNGNVIFESNFNKIK